MDNGSNEVTDINKKSNGIFLSWAWFAVFILSAVALSTIVGLIVHFAHPEKVCFCPSPEIPVTPSTTPSLPATTTPTPTSEDYVWELCLNISAARNECLPCHLTTEAPITTTTPTPPASHRLPGYFVPSHYDVDLRPDIYGPDSADFSFTGEVSIHLECVQATTFAVVHKRQIEVDESTINVYDVTNGENIAVRGVTFDEVTEFFSIKLAKTVIPGDQVVISMKFKGPLRLDMVGMYWSDYMEGSTRKYMVATQFESTDARKAFPCLDEPQLKATFNISLQHQPNMVALANMPNNTYQVMPDGWVKSTFEKTSVRMPTYLVALAVAEFTFVDNHANGSYSLSDKYMRYWAQPDYIADGHAAWAAKISPPMFDFFERYFNLAFDLPKTDQICVPDFDAGAMENWGLITYRELRMIFKENYSTFLTRQRMTGTIAHELLHMWLGNVVTCRWWSDLWLQEGMARFHQHEAMGNATAELGYDWNMDAVFFSQVYYRALDSDSTGSSHPLTNTAAVTQADADAMFTSITYDKGGCVIRMARAFMGKDRFDEGMRNYVDKMKYGNAIEDDLYASWEEASPMTPSVGEILRTWSNQMGYPLVTFSRSDDGTKVSVTQRMYLLDTESPLIEDFPSRYGYVWNVPISYMTKNAPTRVDDWLHRENKTFDLSQPLGADDWILANIGQTGFYRVNYDTTTWQALIKQLTEDHTVFGVLNRAQLVQDSLKLSRSGEVDQVTALNVMRYLEREDDYLPFYAMTMASDYLNGLLSVQSTYSKYRGFIRTLVQRNYNTMDWKISETDPLTSIYLKSLTMETACKYGLDVCQNAATDLFGAYMNDPSNMTIIPPDLRPAVYCTAAREMGESVWEFILDRYLKEDDLNESPVLRDALSCTRDVSLLNRLFMMAVDGDLRSGDQTSVMLAVTRNVNAKHLVWENLNSMWDTLPARNSVLSAVSEFYATEMEYNKLLKLTESKATDLKGAEESILRRVRANMRWMERNAEAVRQWLEALPY